MTWTQGRRLEQMIGNGQNLFFTYNADGIRTSKTVNGITHYYHLAGTQILSEEWTDANEVQHLIIYHYDANGQPVGMSYRNSTQGANEYESFLFVKNLQGDIIKVLDEEGNLLVSYTYDAWGNFTVTVSSGVTTLESLIVREYNPIRYRGYYYDIETEWYYLQSRYYNPIIGRFLNADVYVSTGQGLLGYNMFAYCNNNPIVLVDTSGKGPISLIALGIVALISTITLTASDDINQPEPQSVKYDVPMYKQGNTKLCWAYCQTMIESYQSGKRLNKQAAKARAKEIAIARHGESSWNKGGSPLNLGEKIDNVNSINDLYDILVEHGPVYAFYHGDAAHLIVVTGADVTNNIVYTNNPWGYRGKQTFSQFQSGVATIFGFTDKSMQFGCIYLIEEE